MFHVIRVNNKLKSVSIQSTDIIYNHRKPTYHMFSLRHFKIQEMLTSSSNFFSFHYFRLFYKQINWLDNQLP